METSKSRIEDEKQEAAKAEYEKLLTMRSGGTYIPPARLRALQSQITDKSSKAYQRMAWEALKKSINGLINKVNVSNIKHIVPELFGENLIRGRGLFCRSIMKAQASSLPFTPIYAAMAAIVNTKLPMVGELLLKRLIVQFKKGFKRNDKAVCLSATTFIAHLCNQQVANEVVAAQILLLLLHRPTDDSVEIAVGLTREVGQHLEDMNQVIALAVFDQFRNILHEADIDKRVQYMIEVLFQVRKDKYKDNPAIKEELDLVEEEDQITHVISLDDAIDVSEHLNIFKFDPDWEANEEQYNRTKAEIFGEVSDNDEEDDGEGEEDESEDSGDEEEKDKVLEIRDQSNADLVALRKTIYLTIMSSIDPEECCHKLMKVQLPGGMEAELPSMIVECCSQEKTYSKFYGLVGEKFAKINRLWAQLFEEAFSKYFDTIHRYETNRLRNIARFFGHLLSSDGIGWHVISIIHLNEEETTASSRIFIKILFEDLVEAMGMPKLQARLKDDACRPHCEGIFPRDNQRNIRFSINYFTSIKMGPLTEEMREYLANLPKQSLPAPTAAADDSRSDSSSVSSYSSYTGSSYSKSPSPVRNLSVERRRSPSRDSRTRHSRGRSLTSSMSRSITPARHHDRYSRSISPPRRGRPGSSQSRSSRARDRLKYNSTSPPRHRHVRESRSRTRSISRSLTPERRYRRYSSSASPPRLSHRKSSFSRSPQTRGRAPRRTNDYAVSTSRRRSNSRRSHRSPSRNLKSLPRRRQSRSPRPRAVKKYDRSVTPPRRGRTRTPPRRGRRYSSYSDSRSPPSKKRRRRSSDSRSPPRRNLRRDSRSVSPPRRSLRRDSTSSSPPAKKRRNLSNSRSPPPRRAADSR